MKCFSFLIASIFLTVFTFASDLSSDPISNEEGRTPENQVYQFMSKLGNARLYLWIPENCKKLRGILILCPTATEELIVGWPAVRKSCAANDLGIVWSMPSFWYWAPDPKITSLQKLLDGLAKVSGYPEISTVPWLPMGESAHLNMYKALIDTMPERCLAGIALKNASYPANRTVPVLLTEGTAQEWSQPSGDIRKSWQGSYSNICDLRKISPGWAVSEVLDPGTGHFNCTNHLANYIANYIDLVAKARLSHDGSPRLVDVNLLQGVLADLPSSDVKSKTISPYSPTIDQARPWYFSEASAKDAQSFSDVDWEAQTQLPMVTDPVNCVIKPWSNNGVTAIDVSTSSDFSLKPTFLDKIPAGFKGAGEQLAKSDTLPVLEWLCGPFISLGGGHFRILLDRTYDTGGIPCIIARADAVTDAVDPLKAIRYSNQPLTINLLPNKEGAKQKITFQNINDVTAGTTSIQLSAHSDSGLPVHFYVDYGPAMVKDDQLIFTKIPPSTSYPVEVNVVAWQWGSNVDQKVQTADLVHQVFHIFNP